MSFLNYLPATFHGIRSTLRSWRTSYLIKRANPNVTINHPVSWTCDNPAALTIGSYVTISAFCEIVIFAKSRFSPVPGQLIIGDRTFLGSFGNIRAAGGKIVIGNDCLIAQNVSLIGSNHQIKHGQIYWQLPWDERKTGVTIGNNVWLGCGVTVLPGCSVGDNAIVGAGSIVTKNIPAGTIWFGNPARQMRVIE